jgi:hypothetical protein
LTRDVEPGLLDGLRVDFPAPNLGYCSKIVDWDARDAQSLDKKGTVTARGIEKREIAIWPTTTPEERVDYLSLSVDSGGRMKLVNGKVTLAVGE